MRQIAATAVLAALLLAAPASAQLRANVPGSPAPSVVQATPGSTALGDLFASDRFRVNHSYELSYSSFGGQSLGLGVYTASLGWQPTDNLAARVDIGVAHSPFGSSGVQDQLFGDDPARVFIQNAELAYRPTDGTEIRLQFQQSPFGRFASPYGYGALGGYGPYAYAPYGYSPYGFNPYGGSRFSARFGSGGGDLFWRTGR